MTTWRETAAEISGQLARAGFDIVQAFPSRLVGEVGGQPVHPDRLGLLVGNTRALWPHVTHAVQRDGALRESPDPIDCYCVRWIERALARSGHAFEVHWAHTPPPDAYPIQALAHAAGLCDIAPCRLAIHERFGPWFALRAVAVLDLPGPETARPAPHLCAPCPAPCRQPFEAALAGGADLEGDWRRWLAVRDACPIGREHRYTERQLEYHYTKQRGLLLPGDREGGS